MKSQIRNIDDHGSKYQALAFVCPGCVVKRDGATGLHMLPISGDTDRPMWTFDGNLDAPTLSPSILTRAQLGDPPVSFVCHSFLRNGVFEFLGDCTHEYANQHVPIPDLPDWFARELETGTP